MTGRRVLRLLVSECALVAIVRARDQKACQLEGKVSLSAKIHPAHLASHFPGHFPSPNPNASDSAPLYPASFVSHSRVTYDSPKSNSRYRMRFPAKMTKRLHLNILDRPHPPLRRKGRQPKRR